MKRTWMILVAIALVFGLGTMLDDGLTASNKIAEMTETKCTVCHDKPGSKLMTDRGKYWELMGEFRGYEEIRAGFGRCTQCHQKKPGSKKMTREGRRFAELFHDMDALRAWTMRHHPTPEDVKVLSMDRMQDKTQETTATESE